MARRSACAALGIALSLGAASAGVQLPAHRVADIQTAPASPSSGPSGFAQLGSSALFWASTPQTSYELWRTDGTSVGTQ